VAIGAIVVFVHYVLGRKLTGPAVLGINLVVLAGTLAVSGMFLRSAIPSVARDATPRYEVREWWKVATSFMFISASGIVLSQNSDVVLVGSLVGTRAAALYGVCTQLTSFIGFGSVAIAVIAMPMVAELFGKGDLGTLRRMVSVIAWVNVLATIPGLVLLVVFGRWLLQGYGSEFVEAYPVLVVLAASQAFGIMVGGGLGGFLLNMTDHHRTGAAIIGGSALLNIVLSLLLIPRYGLLGAAAATSAAVVVKAVVVTVFVQRKLQINPLPAWRRG
jgi:O-antigen/teichoic acid export membrane protein